MRTIHNFKLGIDDGVQFDGSVNKYIANTTFVIFRDKKGTHRVSIDAGNSDDIRLFREGTSTYILTTNTRYGYCGITVYDYEIDSDDTGEIYYSAGKEFFQNASEEVCEDWDELANINLCKKLADLYCELSDNSR